MLMKIALNVFLVLFIRRSLFSSDLLISPDQIKYLNCLNANKMLKIGANNGKFNEWQIVWNGKNKGFHLFRFGQRKIDNGPLSLLCASFCASAMNFDGATN